MAKNKKRKKIRVKKIALFVILLMIIGGVALLFYNSKKLNVQYDKEVTIELGSNYNIKEAIKNIKNGEITSEEINIDTTKIGTQELPITIKDDFNKTHEYIIKVNIVDKEAPTIEGVKNIEITEGNDVDFFKDITVKDNSGEEIEATKSGDYDTNKVGEYEMQYHAKDSSGNETTEEFKLIVKEKPVQNYYKAPSAPTMPDKTFTTSKGFSGATKNGITYIDGYLIANKTYNLPSTYNPGGLTSETKKAADEMFAAAQADGMPSMWAQSGFRSYETQNRLYTSYVNADGKSAADTYSARPGHSEHQTGLAFDVCATGYACISSGFNGTAPANWLSNNAYKYGFILRYPSGKSNETGYMYESWHFRYVGTDLAKKLYNDGNWITMENYFGITSEYSY